MKSIITLFLLVTTLALHAQDAIYKKDKTKIDGKVLEVGDWNVKYRQASNPDGPIYTIHKNEIVIIIYQNGTSDIFTSEVRRPRHKKFDSLAVNFKRNMIGVDIGEFSNVAVNITWEHIFGKKGKTGLRIPFSVGIGPGWYSYNHKVFSAGADFLFFPTGQGKLRYYVAPYAEVGLYSGSYWFHTYNADMAISYYQHYREMRYSGGVKNGIQFQATRNFSVTADLGFGLRYSPKGYWYNYVQPASRANLILGYRF